MKNFVLLSISICLLLAACRKDSFITSPDASVYISTDSLHYDTVFTSSGSTYRSFFIRNDNNQKINLSSLTLSGGTASSFTLNVDGAHGTSFSNIEINAHDSVYVFAQVNIDPSLNNLPFIVQDSILINYNGKTRKVQLEAWGQNAHFLRNKIVSNDETWNNDLPYVILGSLTVNEGKKLTINKGCRIYMHADAPVFVDGSLQVNGLKDSADRVYFTGDRLDEPYRYFPASWPGIYFSTTSKDNIFNFATIKNAYQAIGVDGPSVNTNPKLVLNQCIIDNAYDAGIIAIQSSITATNTLVSNCGKNLFLIKGGDYFFTHCTVVSIANLLVDHKDPVLTLTNYDNTSTAPLTAHFNNCIFWGEYGLTENEVLVDKSGTDPFSVNFQNVLWKVQSPPGNVTSQNIIANQSPQFEDINTAHNFYNFRLRSNSPAVDMGANTGIIIDLDGNPRPVNQPDIGCYERQ